MLLENDRERSEKGVEDRINDRDVHSEAEHDRLCDKEH